MRLKIKIKSKIMIKRGTRECETRQSPRDRSFQFGPLG
jgi:hypothetical protein